jgi:hypothetical protein
MRDAAFLGIEWLDYLAGMREGKRPVQVVARSET